MFKHFVKKIISVLSVGAICSSVLVASANAMTTHEKIKKFDDIHRELVLARKNYYSNPHVYYTLRNMGVCVLLAEQYLIDGRFFEYGDEKYNIEKCTELDINCIIFNQIKGVADEEGLKKPDPIITAVLSNLYKGKQVLFCFGKTDDRKHIYGIFCDDSSQISLEKITLE